MGHRGLMVLSGLLAFAAVAVFVALGASLAVLTAK